MPLSSPSLPAWLKAAAPVPYDEALAFMEKRVEAILEGSAGSLVWLLEHPPLYTAGTGASAKDVRADAPFPIFPTGRGGKHTYHGPGQRVVYVMDDLKQRDQDLRAYVARLEAWIIAVLSDFGVQGERREGRVGIWVVHEGREEKIAAIGVRARRWVTSHGLSLNVAPDLSHFGGIVPCGLDQYGVTSLKALGLNVTLQEVDEAFKRHQHIAFPHF